MEKTFSVREGLVAIENLFNREITNYPGLNRDYLINRGRSYGRGEAPWVYQSLGDLWTAQTQSRIITTYNEHALCAIENRVNYVTGEKGFGVEATPRRAKSGRGAVLCDRVQDFLEVFEELNAVDEMISECQMRYDRDGEYFIRLFFQEDGTTQLRFVEPEHVYFNAGDTLVPRYSFGIETAENDVVTPKAYWICERPWETSETKRVDAKYIVHVKANATMNCKRGYPTFLSVGPNLMRCEDLLGSMTQIARTRAKIALIRRLMNVSKTTAESMIDRITRKKDLEVNRQPVNVEELRPGTILTTNDLTQYEFPDYKFGADDFVSVLRAELETIASRFKMPLWMFAAIADVKYSNAFVVESSAAKEFTKLQRTHHKAWVTNRVDFRRSVYWRAVNHAIAADILPREVITGVKLVPTGPVIITRDHAAEAQTNKVYFDMGVRDKTSIQQEQGLNPDDVKENKIVEFRAGTMVMPIPTVEQVGVILTAIGGGATVPDTGYSLISLLIGVPKEVVAEVYKVKVRDDATSIEPNPTPNPTGNENVSDSGIVLSGNQP